MRVYWPEDGGWFEGKVLSCGKQSHEYGVLFEDGQMTVNMPPGEKGSTWKFHTSSSGKNSSSSSSSSLSSSHLSHAYNPAGVMQIKFPNRQKKIRRDVNYVNLTMDEVAACTREQRKLYFELKKLRDSAPNSTNASPETSSQQVRREERKGKERKGKERKGKERKGKERKGKERWREGSGKRRSKCWRPDYKSTFRQISMFLCLPLHFSLSLPASL